MPPLRERLEDLLPLCAYFQRNFSTRYSRPNRELPEELRKAFACYGWPGNIRELENMIRRFVLLPDLELALAHLQAASEPTAHSRPEPPRFASPAKLPSALASRGRCASCRAGGAGVGIANPGASEMEPQTGGQATPHLLQVTAE
jgi:transcriptional regulator with PAS, ATPase and Fis domain